MIDGHTDTHTHTHTHTQATTIPEGQNWARVKMKFGKKLLKIQIIISVIPYILAVIRIQMLLLTFALSLPKTIILNQR